MRATRTLIAARSVAPSPSRRLMALAIPALCAFAVVLVVACPAARALEPPRPGELQLLAREGKLDEALRRARALGDYKIDPQLVQRAKLRLERARLGLTSPILELPWAGSGLPSKGSPKVLALLIDFSDYPATVPAATVQSMLFGHGSASSEPYGSLRDYYARASYGQLDFQGTVLGWYDTGQPRSSVPETIAGQEGLIMQALQSYDATTDYRQFDNNGDGKIDYFLVIWTGPSGTWASFWYGYQTDWWLNSSFRLDGMALGTFSWQRGEADNMNTVQVEIHETGHALGLPDYYDYDPSVGPRGGVGSLDMMSASWGDHNAFSKWLLGWITPRVLSSGSAPFTLAPSGTSPDALLVMPGARADTPFHEYFLVQNRYRVGNDGGSARMPADGLLIWHVNATLDDAGTYFKYDNSFTSHKLLRLMEADGLEEIEQNLRANAGDYYVSGATFGPTTKPDSSSYYSPTKTNVWVGDISWSGTSLRLTASVQGAPPLASNSEYAFSPDAATVWCAASQSVAVRATGGSGIGTGLHYSLDGGATWSTSSGSSATVVVSSEGSHHLLYYASDSLSTEAVHDAGYVNIDTLKPVASATAASVKKGKTVALRYRVDDGPTSCGKALVSLVIRQGSRTWRTFGLGSCATNTPLTYIYRATLAKGTYTYSVSAVDLANNATVKAATAKLVIK